MPKVPKIDWPKPDTPEVENVMVMSPRRGKAFHLRSLEK